MILRDIERLENIKLMLVSITKGTFNFHIPRTEEDDEIESIATLLNRMTEEMQDMLSAYVENIPGRGLREHHHLLFIIDHQDRILYMSPDAVTTLGHTPEVLLEKQFSQVLAKSNVAQWQALTAEMFTSREGSKQEELLIGTISGLERRYHCAINLIYNTDTATPYLLVSMFETRVKNSVVEADFQLRLRQGATLKHLEIGKPNVFKLKNGFKQLFGYCVFGFFKEERIKKGQLLLESTDLPIKTIAGMCGYSSGSHFRRDIKGRDGGLDTNSKVLSHF